MADFAKCEPQPPGKVPVPKPRRARTGVASVSTVQESQQDSPPLERRRGASVGDESTMGVWPITEGGSQSAVVAGNCTLPGQLWTQTLTDDPLHEEPHNGTGCDGGPASNASDSQSLTNRLTMMRLEEDKLQERVRVRRKECEEVEVAVRELRGEEERLRNVTADLNKMVKVLEVKVETLKREDTKLRQAREEREQGRGQPTDSLSTAEDHLRERELDLQRRLDKVNDRESANRQENLRLQRLADQLHMQKKDLDHQRFDLENFGPSTGTSGEKMAELREREERMDCRERELSDREIELDRRQSNFEKWMRERQIEIEKRLSELQVKGDQTPPSRCSSSPYAMAANLHSTPHHLQQQYIHYPPSHPPRQAPVPIGTHYNPQQTPASHYDPSPPQAVHDITSSGYRNTAAYYTGPQSQPVVPEPMVTTYYPSPPFQDVHNVPFTTTHPPNPPLVPSPPTASSSSTPGVTRTGNYTHAGHSYNDLSERPPSTTHQHRGGVASARGGVAGDGGGMASARGGVAGGGSTQQSSPSHINKDEEVAAQMTVTSPLWQTTDDISADAEYARRLQQELNTISPPAIDQDRQLALAMMADGTDEFLELSNPEEVQRYINEKMLAEAERKRQEETDAELARRLEVPDEETN